MSIKVQNEDNEQDHHAQSLGSTLTISSTTTSYLGERGTTRSEGFQTNKHQCTPSTDSRRGRTVRGAKQGRPRKKRLLALAHSELYNQKNSM